MPKVKTTCVMCGVVFMGRLYQTCCSARCRSKKRNELHRGEIRKKLNTFTCRRCGKEFQASHNSGKRVYCTKECWVNKSSTIGHYVYGWYESSEAILPFYIGEGTGKRAWERHLVPNWNGVGKRDAFCEQLRTSQTVIKIYRSSLTKEGAKLVEAVLTKVFEDMGAKLVHQCDPMVRMDKGELEC